MKLKGGMAPVTNELKGGMAPLLTTNAKGGPLMTAKGGILRSHSPQGYLQRRLMHLPLSRTCEAPPPPAPPPGLAPLSVLSRKKVVIATAGYNTLTWAFPRIHAARQLARSTWVSDTDVADALDDCGWQMGLVIGALKFRDPSKQTDHLGLHPSNMHGLVQNTQSLRSIFAKVCISSCCKVVLCGGHSA